MLSEEAPSGGPAWHMALHFLAGHIQSILLIETNSADTLHAVCHA